ncbi:MAG: hypothetical protein WBA51_03050 [Erythrobacter sp.]
MADAKTIPTGLEVDDFIASVEPAAKREDARVLLEVFERATGEPAKMWGPLDHRVRQLSLQI